MCSDREVCVWTIFLKDHPLLAKPIWKSYRSGGCKCQTYLKKLQIWLLPRLQAAEGFLSDVYGNYDAAFYLAGVSLALSGAICIPLRRIARWESERVKKRVKSALSISSTVSVGERPNTGDTDRRTPGAVEEGRRRNNGGIGSGVDKRAS
ncbi:monocarboxylate transporter 9 [Plakobranchus ocellatus]|uniref:Monocarboxylate transporter 9 n=1 Tax=Plakobranchus ocellatus TaxID=259542 RepID=A0AAV4ALG4_9GAST|nr:monocarboxylate transporter 9 [Plakobranchus ocellatus]